MQASTRKAEIRNEKSANAPEVVSRITPDASHRAHRHHDAHDHKRHKPARPWMIGHWVSDPTARSGARGAAEVAIACLLARSAKARLERRGGPAVYGRTRPWSAQSACGL